MLHGLEVQLLVKILGSVLAHFGWEGKNKRLVVFVVFLLMFPG